MPNEKTRLFPNPLNLPWKVHPDHVGSIVDCNDEVVAQIQEVVGGSPKDRMLRRNKQAALTVAAVNASMPHTALWRLNVGDVINFFQTGSMKGQHRLESVNDDGLIVTWDVNRNKEDLWDPMEILECFRRGTIEVDRVG